MKWYLKVVRDNYANFQGRARRKEYWMFTLFNAIFMMIVTTFSVIIGLTLNSPLPFAIYIIYALGIIIPSLAVTVRRLHDIGKSGWYYFVGLIPFIGGIWLLILLVTEGETDPNNYGSDPKVPTMDEINDFGRFQIQN
ncbi:DUF805 domain-containing protein [Snuella lapsa]|uniref:DUF805 domain-containing protein n=1 Tax=Snuella lapsa TaxID=870481 RepID=A0ABP6WWH7_9FLAO